MTAARLAALGLMSVAPAAWAGPGAGPRPPEASGASGAPGAAYVPPPPPGPVRARVSILGEAVRDEAIGRVYGGASVAGEVAFGAGLPFGIEAGVSVGYRRLGGAALNADGVPDGAAATWLWYAPVSATVGYGYDMGTVDLFAGLGPSYVLWAEKPGTQAGVGYSGGKVGLLLEGGARIPLGRPLTDIRYEPPSPTAAELVLTAGWRGSFRRHGDECPTEEPCGLDFSALRLGAGLGVRF